MAKVSFPYGSFAVSSVDPHHAVRVAYRPQLFLTISAGNDSSERFQAIVDSGADACLFPLSLAIALKLDLFKMAKAMTGGVGTQSNITYYDTVRLDLGHGIAFTALVGFTEGLNSAGIGLLGQSGFFENFNVEFLHRQKVFTIERS